MEGYLTVADKITVPDTRRIAAIDFGTSFCSLAYALSTTDKVVNLSINGRHERVPTAILLEKLEGDTLAVCSFGYEAQEDLTTLSTSELQKHLYFECFKMKLRDENVSNLIY